jgi:hypothetical protein
MFFIEIGRPFLSLGHRRFSRLDFHSEHSGVSCMTLLEEMAEALRAIVDNFDGGERPTRGRFNDMDFNSPSAGMVDSEHIFTAIDILAKYEAAKDCVVVPKAIPDQIKKKLFRIQFTPEQYRNATYLFHFDRYQFDVEGQNLDLFYDAVISAADKGE